MLFGPMGDRPAPAGEELARDPDADVEHEFKLEQAEIASEPTADLGALESDLRARRDDLIDSAQQRGVLVAAVGTSPVAAAPTETPDERYHRMHERYGLVAGDQLTCGTHVHVAVDSRAEGVAAIDGVRRWLAVLLALSGNSPFWSGADTSYASYRRVSWGRWPSAGPTETFGDEANYDRAVHDLIATGAAIDAGMIYFDVRLSASYPTVEFRVADVGQDVGESVLQAALCRAAVDTAVDSPAADLPAWLLRSAAWGAARYGLTAELVDVDERRPRAAERVVDRALDELAPALRRNGDEDFVRSWVDHVWQRGTGAQLQRGDLGTRGRADDVVRAAVARTSGSRAER
jgi:carboxylate-amine ligase